jgi:oligopeptide/dipeptide ABC transporter ATP-binding protein
MYAGTIAESGPAPRLFAQPSHPYTQALLDCELSVADDGPGRLASIPGQVADLVTVPPGCIFADRCPQVMAECRVVNPGLRPVTAGHAAACLLVPAR